MPDLLLTFDFPPMSGGIARWMSEIARRYPAGTLTVSTGRMPGDRALDAAFPNAIDRVNAPATRLRTLQGQARWMLRALALHRAKRVRFAWCDNVRPSAYPAWALRRFGGVPYGVIVHGSDLFDLRKNIRRSAIKRRIARALLGNAATLVANSHWTQGVLHDFLSELGLDALAQRTRVVPLGTDPVRFRPDIDARPLQARYNLPNGRWLVTVARLEAFKGIDTVIRALPRIASRIPDVRYAVVGRGSFRAGAEVLAAEQGVADRVHFLSHLGDDELPAAYALASVYAGLTRETPSEVEGFGISLVEAQAAGKPVVAGNAGGIPTAVRDGVTGILIDPLNVEHAAETFIALLEHPERAISMGRAGRDAVEQYFNWDRVVADLLRIAEEHGGQDTQTQPAHIA